MRSLVKGNKFTSVDDYEENTFVAPKTELDVLEAHSWSDE